MGAGFKYRQVVTVVSHEFITTDVVRVLIDATDLELKARGDFGIQNFLFRSQQQPLYRTAMGNVGIQNFINILSATVVIPRALRIDHHHRAELTTVEAATFIHSDTLIDLEFLAPCFHVFL